MGFFLEEARHTHNDASTNGGFQGESRIKTETHREKGFRVLGASCTREFVAQKCCRVREGDYEEHVVL